MSAMMPSLHRVHRLRGFSLLEMVVVVAVLASLLAITMPAIFRPLGKSGLREAAKQVQAALLEARTRAVEAGVLQEFRYEPGGRRYEIRARRDEDTEPSGTSAALGAGKLAANAAEALKLNAVGAGGSAMPESLHDALPDGIVFADPQEATAEQPLASLSTGAPLKGAAVSDDMATAQEALAEEVSGENWSAPLRFYPNGRGGNALLKLRDSNSWSIAILLRGLVGTALIGEPRHEETNSEAAPVVLWPANRAPDSR
jgi:prepilin-type N-terminal cleavage/methylation domain-containing protein